MREYPKIEGPFKRTTEGPNRNKVIDGKWNNDVFELLANLRWTWTEKIDGTNVRVGWDGHKVTFGGRTDRAQFPTGLLTVLVDLFPEALMEQAFGARTVTLYGEGYGAGIQHGGVYRPDKSFALFDILADDKWWLLPEDVTAVAETLGIVRAPVIMFGSIYDAIARVTVGLKTAWGMGDAYAEGLVGTAPGGILTRAGNRIMTKVKTVDFKREI